MGDVKDCFEHTVTPPKTKVTMEKQRFEDVSSDKIVQKHTDVQFSRVYLFWNPAEALWKPWDLLSFQAASLSLVPGRTWWDKKNNEVFNKLFDGGKTSSIEKSSKKKGHHLVESHSGYFLLVLPSSSHYWPGNKIGKSASPSTPRDAESHRHRTVKAINCYTRKMTGINWIYPPHPGCQWHFRLLPLIVLFSLSVGWWQMKVYSSFRDPRVV